jgi:hypothetical protein
METSMLIARIASVIYLAAALGGFLSRNFYRELKNDMFKNAALTYLMGFIAVIVGALIVNVHNVWAGNWTLLVTIIGWMALLKGICLIAFPKFMERVSTSFLSEKGQKVFPYVTLALGLLFGYFGFDCGCR